MNFYFAGGAMEVGGSCIYMRINNPPCGILLDSGIRQSGGKDPLPDFRGIQDAGGVDAIVVSHAHMDHIGSLPVISKAYPSARIYMTTMTLDLCRVLLADSLKLMERKEEEIPQYSEEDVNAMLSRINVLSYQSEAEILPEIGLTFFQAGHIAGAACAYIQTPEGTVFYSGDVAGFSQQAIEGILIPKLRPDIMLLESTYGDRLHSARALEEKRLVDIAAENIAQGRKILIPAFALGRSQEVLLILRQAMINKIMPEVPVYVDGMVRDINRMYVRNPSFLKNALAKRIWKGTEPFYTDYIKEVPRNYDRSQLLEAGGPAIFVSSSGMLTGGPSTEYAKYLLPRTDACVILTGYQDEEAPGRALANLAAASEEEDRRITLNGITIPVRCKVTMVGLSAHADQSELCGIVEKLTPRNIILVHGNQEAIGALGSSLASDIRRRIFQPACGDTLEIDIRGKRKQLSRDLPFTMSRSSLPEAKDCAEIWSFWTSQYPRRAFTIEQLAYLWYGKKDLPEETLFSLQEILLGSPYFSRNLRRLYMIQPNTQEEIEKNSQVFHPNDINYLGTQIDLLLQDQPGQIKKKSFQVESKEVALVFDFPDASGIDLEAISSAIYEKTGWTVHISPKFNHLAAEWLLRKLFGGRLYKISHMDHLKSYSIRISNPSIEDKDLAEEFRQKTGWSLDIDGVSFFSSIAGTSAPSRQEQSDSGWFYKKEGAQPVDQNLAQSILFSVFDDSPHQPYKCSIKAGAGGKYLDVVFLSPGLGMRYAHQLEEAARLTGWDVHVANQVNQQQLFACAALIAEKHGIVMLKSPSYLPASQSIKIKTAEPLSPEDAAAIQEEFLAETGVPLIIE